MDHLTPREGEKLEKNLYRGDHANPNKRRRNRSGNLREQVINNGQPVLQPWSTPTCQEVEHPNTELTESGRRKTKNGKDSHSIGLADKVNWPTPREFMHKDSKIDRGKGNLGEKAGGQLNPDWVEWLMGWPVGWTSLEPITELLWLDWSVDPADMETPQNWPTVIQGDWKGQKRKDGTAGMLSGIIQNNPQISIDPIPRVATGIKDRVNRLKGIGNGQVSLCTSTAFMLLYQRK